MLLQSVPPKSVVIITMTNCPFFEIRRTCFVARFIFHDKLKLKFKMIWLYLHGRQAKISVDCIDIYNDARIRKHKEEDETRRRKLNLGWIMAHREGGKRIKLQTNVQRKEKATTFKPNQENMNMSSVLEKTRFGGSDSTTKV